MGNLTTPKSVQKLQKALHAKAKAEAGYRFYALYDKISREDILAHAYAQCPLRMRELTEVIGVDRRTVERWRTWWRDSFTTTPFWQVARAAFMPPIDPGRLPAALIERFAGDDADRLVALLRFMGPITGGRMHAR